MQKAKHLHLELEKKIPNIHSMYAVFEKYDGWYGTLDVEYGEAGYICSSAGREIPSLRGFSEKLQEAIAAFPFLIGRIIFEIQSHDYTDFHTLNGAINRKSEPLSRPYLMVHDLIIDADEPFSDRYTGVKNLVNELELDEVQLAPVLEITKDMKVCQLVAEEVWRKGGEGVIIKDLRAPYCAGKRNSFLMKIKEEVTKDLLVTHVVEGQGKYSGTTGALRLINREGREFLVSGMSDLERDIWWSDNETIVGKIVEVKAMKELKDGSLREPRFKAVRHDKAAGDFD